MTNNLPAAALEFATIKHAGQTRKGADKSPYIGHPIAVALVLRDEGGVTDETLLTAALLHDTVEDTVTSFEEIEQRFGATVADLVREMTDDKKLDKEVRKQLQIDHARHASLGAKQIKIADKICNIRDLVSAPPADWSVERRLQYVDWSEAVFAGLAGVNDALDRAFRLAAGNARAQR